MRAWGREGAPRFGWYCGGPTKSERKEWLERLRARSGLRGEPIGAPT